MYYIGLMSGTSTDAIDAAIVKFDKKAIVEFYREYPIEDKLKNQILLINNNTTLMDLAKLDNELGHSFADVVNKILNEANITANQITAIGSHGQTVLHLPNTKNTTSIQISDPNIICAETGITTVSDFRRMDMAFGGQGAPLASAFHEYQFKNSGKSIVILNIGGFANITMLPSDTNKIVGFDTGPGNTLLDAWIKKNKDIEFDKDGLWARSGNENNELLEQLLCDGYFTAKIPKSTGREYFNLNWLNKKLEKINKTISPEDIQATLLKLSAITIANAIKKYADDFDEVVVCGGGANNSFLMKTIENLLKKFRVVTTSDYGLSPDCVESVTFAWLSKKRLENKPSNIPTVTGATKSVILGGIYSPAK